MEINITLSQIWNNTSIRGFLMRSQAQRELEKLLSHVEDEFDALETLDTNIYDYYGDFDTFEEELYSGDYHEIAEAAGIELIEDEEEDEEEEVTTEDVLENLKELED